MAASVWIMFCSVSVCGARSPGGHGASEGRDDALGHRRRAGREAQRVADGHDGVADHGLGRVAEGDGGQVGGVVDLEQGHVLGLVVADQRGRAGPWSGRTR